MRVLSEHRAGVADREPEGDELHPVPVADRLDAPETVEVLGRTAGDAVESTGENDPVESQPGRPLDERLDLGDVAFLGQIAADEYETMTEPGGRRLRSVGGKTGAEEDTRGEESREDR